MSSRGTIRTNRGTIRTSRGTKRTRDDVTRDSIETPAPKRCRCRMDRASQRLCVQKPYEHYVQVNTMPPGEIDVVQLMRSRGVIVPFSENAELIVDVQDELNIFCRYQNLHCGRLGGQFGSEIAQNLPYPDGTIRMPIETSFKFSDDVVTFNRFDNDQSLIIWILNGPHAS